MHSCKDGFDYSDHIVLHMVQYIIPAAIELAYVRVQCISTNRRSSSTYKYIPTVALAVVIIAVSLRSMLLTGMFFHTGAESFAALLIVFFLFAIPLYKCTYYDFAMKMMFPSRLNGNEH